MTFYEHITEFAGLPVVQFPPDAAAEIPAPEQGIGGVAWRLDCNDNEDYGYCDKDFGELLSAFLDGVDGAQVRAIVTGLWNGWADDADNAVATDLAEAADRLPALRSLFVGELTDDQAQLSWNFQRPLTPVLRAYPELEELWFRGQPDTVSESEAMAGFDDSFVEPETKHAALRTLVLQSGGLPGGVVRAIATCDFPELTHLDLYLGDPNYGGNTDLTDLEPYLAGTCFPKLRHLGIKNSLFQDQIAAAVAQAPVVAQLESLDLSLGTLGDDGAAALLAGQPLGHLRRLDLSHHYLSKEMQQRLRDAWPTVEIDLSDYQGDGTEDRYIAAGE